MIYFRETSTKCSCRYYMYWWLSELPYWFNSAIHKAAVRSAAIQNNLRRSFLLAAPIDSQWTLFCSTGIVPGKAGNGSASGFVNITVKPIFCLNFWEFVIHNTQKIILHELTFNPYEMKLNRTSENS